MNVTRATTLAAQTQPCSPELVRMVRRCELPVRVRYVPESWFNGWPYPAIFVVTADSFVSQHKHPAEATRAYLALIAELEAREGGV